MTDAEIEDKMKSVVRWWSLTQLLGSFGMPLWLAVVATQWYTYRNMLPGHVALVITFSKCIDVMTDPLMAYYLRKCCMHTIARIAVLGSFVQSVFFAGIFIPFMPVDPWGGDTRVLLQYTVCYVLFFVGDTLTGTPTTTLGTMLKSQRILDERHHNEGLRLGSMAKVGGILLMGLLTYAVSAVFRSQGLEYGAQEGVSRDMSPNANFAVATFFGAAHWLINFYFSVLIMDFENSSIAVDVLEDQRGFLEGFSEMMTSSYNNPFFRQLIGAWVCDQLTITLVKNLLMWFVRHNVEPELGKGCVAFRDPANSQYIERGGFEVNIPKSRFECSADSIVKGGVFFVILGAVTGNVFWQRKLARERDEYGHGNLYRNWLLFNLSSALTNGLMVFVGRGDSRLFWALCFVNGLPFGGEFLTDTVLLFLIGSETWLNRTESPMGEEEHAAQFDAHTTKFSMMKTFIPKVVSLVAEAIPLSMIQIWYKDPNELCEDADGNFIGATACEEKLLYRIPGSADDGTPRYIPQAPQVRELIAFFFYILPTVTTLASYFLKSRFQVTDSADVGFTKSLKHGAPAGGGESTAERVKSPEVEAPLGLSQLAAESAALSAASLGEVQSALAFSRPKMQADAWVGQLIPTTNGQHLFHLPVCDHEFARLPVNVVRFVCQESARSLVLPAALCHQPGDSIVASRAKAAVHGLSGSVLLPACAAVRVLRTAAAAAGALVAAACRRHSSAPPPRAPGGERPLGLLLFGVVGQRTVRHLAWDLLPVLGQAMLAEAPQWRDSPGELQLYMRRAVALAQQSASPTAVPRSIPRDSTVAANPLAHGVPSGGFAAAERRLEKILRNGAPELEQRAARRCALPPPSVAHVSCRPAGGGGFPLLRRALHRLAYLQALGLSCGMAMAAVFSGLAAYWATLDAQMRRRAWKWSVAATVPLFLVSLGAVCCLYFTGLLQSCRRAGDAAVVRLADLLPLSVLHFSEGRASGCPLIFDAHGGGGGVLSSFAVQRGDRRGPCGRGIGYLCLLPLGRQGDALAELAAGHRLLDAVQAECALGADGSGWVPPTWQVVELPLPAGMQYPYRCLLYCIWDVGLAGGTEPK